METVLQHNDLLVHRVHRHEPPVTARPLAIVHMDTDIVAIEKPPSIPVRCTVYILLQPPLVHVLWLYIGSSMWKIQAQFCRFLAWKGAQSDKPTQ